MEYARACGWLSLAVFIFLVSKHRCGGKIEFITSVTSILGTYLAQINGWNCDTFCLGFILSIRQPVGKYWYVHNVLLASEMVLLAVNNPNYSHSWQVTPIQSVVFGSHGSVHSLQVQIASFLLWSTLLRPFRENKEVFHISLCKCVTEYRSFALKGATQVYTAGGKHWL